MVRNDFDSPWLTLTATALCGRPIGISCGRSHKQSDCKEQGGKDPIFP